MLQLIREIKKIKCFMFKESRFEEPRPIRLKKPFLRVLIEDTESDAIIKINKTGNEFYLVYDEETEFYLGCTAFFRKLQELGLSGSDLAWLSEELI